MNFETKKAINNNWLLNFFNDLSFNNLKNRFFYIYLDLINDDIFYRISNNNICGEREKILYQKRIDLQFYTDVLNKKFECFDIFYKKVFTENKKDNINKDFI